MFFFLASRQVQIIFKPGVVCKDTAQLVEIIRKQGLEQNSSVPNCDDQARPGMQSEFVDGFGGERDVAAGFERDDLSIHLAMLLL